MQVLNAQEVIRAVTSDLPAYSFHRTGPKLAQEARVAFTWHAPAPVVVRRIAGVIRDIKPGG